jgi:hypothetical protein
MSMRRITPKIGVLLLTFTVGVATVAFWSIPHFIPPEETEEYAVYSALLKELFVKDETKLLIIQNQTLFYENPDYLKSTTSDERIRDMRKYYPSVAEDTLADFDTKYMQPSELIPKFNLPIKYVLIDKLPAERVLIDESELDKGKGRTQTQALFEKYPGVGGVISLSKVGFSKDMTEAFVSVEFTHCALCGRGDKVLLGRKSGVWKVKAIYNGWVS